MVSTPALFAPVCGNTAFPVNKLETDSTWKATPSVDAVERTLLLQVIKDQPYRYSECGLDVVLLGITQYHCEKCGEDFAAIPSPQKLHRIIGINICTENKALLQPKEIQFLRKELRLKAKELARILGVSDSVVSRWENGKASIGEGNDRLLRSIFMASVNEISGIHDTSINILDLFKELPHKRKEIKTPHSINLNPQEWMQSESVCTV